MDVCPERDDAGMMHGARGQTSNKPRRKKPRHAAERSGRETDYGDLMVAESLAVVGTDDGRWQAICKSARQAEMHALNGYLLHQESQPAVGRTKRSAIGSRISRADAGIGQQRLDDVTCHLLAVPEWVGRARSSRWRASPPRSTDKLKWSLQ